MEPPLVADANAKDAVHGLPHLSASSCAKLVVLKSENRRETFDRSKLERSISLACRKRGVESERIDQLVSGIQRQVETIGDAEIRSGKIGEMVMDGLKALDSVAYIRFASVYKDFTEAKDFEDFAGSVAEAAGK